ncbi:MAG: hypothetical protein JO212_20135, partial [Acetobacteraceae bacterium]|nr:hypothetical protein [Acetobacteraceae bacterium]
MRRNSGLCSRSVRDLDHSSPAHRPFGPLALILAGLLGVLAAHMVKDRSAVPLMFLARARLGRLVSRFEALVAAVRAGRVPTRPASRLQDAASLNLPWLE